MEKISSYVIGLLTGIRHRTQEEIDDIDSIDDPVDYTRRQVLEEQVDEINDALGNN
jgi:hypothetical protein